MHEPSILFDPMRNFLRRIGRSFRTDLAMDLGTANTLVYVKGKGIVLNEPSVVAIDTRTKQIVALGRHADRLLGRAPRHIDVLRPLKDGVIADFDAAKAMIRGLLSMAFTLHFWTNPRIVIGIPSGITPVEKRAVTDAAYEAGARRILLVEEPMAAAIGAGLDVDLPIGNMIVDVGGGTTEVAVISLCSTAYSESIRTAGDEMDEAIVRYLQRTMHLEISPRLAADVKIRIGCADIPDKEKVMHVTGKELGKGAVRTAELTSSQICEALEEPVDEILDTIRRAMEDTPPSLLGDVRERGLILTGGGALLTGLDELITKMTGIEAKMADDPLASVVRGCGAAVEDLHRWKRILVS
ncbi:MAG: rod shape-determining protein [Desulfomonilaceae bacterium]|nr:rod shape-determining protein [Desulfomonilaceae bacterium]